MFPPGGMSRGYVPGAVLVDGEIVGVWQRQQRRVTIHPWRSFSTTVREAIEHEGLTLPIAGASKPSVTWA